MSRALRKPFTVESANRTLPLVRAIVADMSRVASTVDDRQQRVMHLMSGRELESGDPYADELALVNDQLQSDMELVDSYCDELFELGIQVKDAVLGQIDYPSELDGRPVLLAWRLGDPEVLFWRECDSPFNSRQPLTADAVSGGCDDELPGAAT
ncbi:MAG: DUF2203 domain-containing protein [Planctomycetales bacterium]|nr:DUF2203 domain-containing protein [Planctomycetales bacterium]